MIAAAAVLLALALGGDDSRYSQTVVASATLNSGGEVEIDNDYGDVHVSRGDAGTVKVTALKHSPNESDLAMIDVHVDAVPGAVKVTTDYPAVTGWFAHQHDSVDYDVRVPAGTKVILRSKYGDGYVSGVGGPVDASSRYGDVEVDGAIGADTIASEYGDVTLSITSIRPADAVTMSTTYGDVTLTLPAGTTPAVHAVTRLGDVNNDFGQSSNGPAVDLRTTFGDVDVRKGGS